MNRRVLLLLTLLPTTAWTHANLVVRRAGENIKIDTAGGGRPCGSAPRGVPAGYTLRPGARLTVRVLETIHHPSHYFVSASGVPDPEADDEMIGLKVLSAVEVDVNGKSSQLSVAKATMTVPGREQDAVAGDTQEQHTKDGSYRQSSAVTLDVTVEIPMTLSCAPTCALQFIQQMEENPESPTYYKSCIDFAVSPDGLAASGPPPLTSAPVTPVVAETKGGCH